ncbi:hypothetical protein ONE63_000675 [Megalurothrips usitatus]|uniref:D-beta-hydroxybutyrate dehydrogenase, mitochondrial n=1 Tax=Megalurothrips usitatus TaxID=439358 RepID=A0AAV7XZQ1_9NEOP|nr:hypothetical protein ONE63_000675 [Megalurothrips usitatus]
MDSRKRRESKAPAAAAGSKLDRPEELPWDVVDRCLLPVLSAHALAVILAFVLNTLRISQVSSWTLFFWFTAITLATLWFYHNLQVTAAGKAVLVTGADNKLGQGIVRQLDELGFTVFAGMRDPACVEAGRLKEQCSGRLHALQLDVTREEDILAARDYVVANLPQGADGLWAVINNEQWAAFGEVEWVPLPVFRQAAEVNLLGAVRVSQVFLPLVRRVKGRIVNVVSVLGHVTAPLQAPYCAVKYAVEAFSDCLRAEMRRWGVDVVVVEPGDYTTGKLWYDDAKMLQQAKEMWEAMPDETRQDYGEHYFEYTVRRALEPYTKGKDTDMGPVTRSLQDAVCRTFPLQRYTAVTRAEKIRMLVLNHLPRSVHDILYV